MAFKKYVILAILGFGSVFAAGQTTLKSGFFLDGMLNRHKINPAVMNKTGYIGIPIISDFTASASTNMGLSKLFFPLPDGQLTSFMNGAVSTDEFLSGLASVNNLDLNLNFDILSGAFYAGNAYHTINLGVRSSSSAYVPYSMFDFMKSGMTSTDVTHYNIRNLTVRTSNTLDLSYGYARKIDDNWSVGGKLRLLVGLADVNAQIDNMDITMSADKWLVKSQGSLFASGMTNVNFTTGGDGSLDAVSINGFNMSSFGGSIDLGVVYKTPVEGLSVSLSVLDLGVMSWNDGAMARTSGDEFVFEGFADIPVGSGGSGTSVDTQTEDLKSQLGELFKFYPDQNHTNRLTMVRPTLNVGIEYELVPDKFSFGLLSSTRFGDVFTLTELILSANYRPCDWFNMALTGDWSNVALSWGAVINFCPNAINFFVGFDFMSTHISPQLMPVYSASPAVSLGLSVPIGYSNKYYKNNRR